MDSAAWTAVFCLLVGACLWPWFRLRRSKQALSPPRGVHLSQVSPAKSKADTDTDIDIIAIHGFDTKSPGTWTWVNPSDLTQSVNWLAEPLMLPSKVGAARIFTCDWPADVLQSPDLVQKTIEEHALLLLAGIRRELFHPSRREGRPVFFIASCLGGLVLAKALVDADRDADYRPIRTATRGVVFLATPFRGTSFQDVAAWVEPLLKVKAWSRGQEASNLINNVKGSTFDLGRVVREFTNLCLDKYHPCYVFTFYETGKMSLPLKILGWSPRWFRWAPRWFRQEKQARISQHHSLLLCYLFLTLASWSMQTRQSSIWSQTHCH